MLFFSFLFFFILFAFEYPIFENPRRDVPDRKPTRLLSSTMCPHTTFLQSADWAKFDTGSCSGIF